MPSALQFYWLSLGTAVLLLSFATVWELRTSSIPNHLTIVFLAFGLGLSVLDHQWAFHLTGFFFAAAPALLAYFRGYVGGGLTKLLAALGSLCGPKVVVLMFLPLVVLSGVVAYRAARKGGSAPIAGSPILLGSFVLATIASRFVP